MPATKAVRCTWVYDAGVRAHVRVVALGPGGGVTLKSTDGTTRINVSRGAARPAARGGLTRTPSPAFVCLVAWSFRFVVPIGATLASTCAATDASRARLPSAPWHAPLSGASPSQPHPRLPSHAAGADLKARGKQPLEDVDAEEQVVAAAHVADGGLDDELLAAHLECDRDAGRTG